MLLVVVRRITCGLESNPRFLSVLVLPGAEANGGDLSARVELERCAAMSHSAMLRLWL